MNKGHNRRMADQYDIPDMNGTIKELISILSTPLTNHTQNAKAIRNMAMLMMHMYTMEKSLLEEFNRFLSSRNRWSSLFMERVLPQLITVAILALLYLIFGDKK